MPPELRELMQRYCRLGCLLPPLEEVVARQAEAKLVLAEMGVVQAQIDSLLAVVVVADGEDSHDG